ncbi:MAG: tetratricopeptide repeat protein [Desulfovibrionaceae bacterium]
MSVPAPAHIGLVDEISVRLGEGQLSEFEIAMYIKKADALMNVSPEVAHCALGILACLSNDEKRAREHHKIAIKLSSQPCFLFNYACSLSYLKHYEEALSYFLQAVEKAPDVPRHLNLAIKLAFELDSPALERLLTLWAKLNKGEDHPARYEVESRALTRMCTDMSSASLDEVWGGEEESAAWAHLQ